MVLAEDHLRLYRGSKIDSKTGQPKVYTPYETLEDMGAYAKLADSVFHDIEISLKDEMRPAQVRSFAFPCVFGYLLCSHRVVCVCATRNCQELLRKVKRRELYPFIGESVIRQGSATKKPNDMWKSIVCAGLMEILGDEARMTVALRENCSQEAALTATTDHDDSARSDRFRKMLRVAAYLAARSKAGQDDLIVSIVKINYGMKDKDPVRAALFYDQARDEDGTTA